MKKLSLFPIVLFIINLAWSQNIPKGYHLIYQQDFAKKEAINDFEFSDINAWRMSEKASGTLELFEASEYQPRVRSPHNIAMLKGLWLEDFILEVDLAQTGKEYGHRDLCLFFGMKDASNFYYVHLATKADDHANNIFLVNDEPRVKIAEKTSTGTDWAAQGSWHKVRIERVVNTGSIKVYFDDFETPVMEATDQHFDFGTIGFGSFDDTGLFDNIRIYAPVQTKVPIKFFD
jgi:hypothetical protein